MTDTKREIPFEIHYRLEGIHWWSRARRRIIVDAISRRSPPSADPLVVDIGCGAGSTLSALSDAGYRTLGIDNNEDALKEASRRGISQVRLGVAPQAFASMPPGPYVFLMADVLEHVLDDRGLLTDIVSAAPAGSLFVVTVPALMSLWSEHDEIYGHYRRYDKYGLKALMEGAGLDLLFISYFCALLFPVIYVVRTLGRLLPKRGLPPDLKEVNPLLNRVLESIFSMERYLLRRVSLPVGSSLIAVAEKKG